VAATLGDLIQLIDNQYWEGQQILNVYYYRVTNALGLADGYLSDMNDSWETTVLDKVKVIQSQYLQHTSREWKNLTNGVDLFVDGSVVNGTHSGSATSQLPSFISAGFILRRESLVTRNGYKRFAGLHDDQVDGNTYVGDTGDMDDIEVALASDLTYLLGTYAEPVIVKRPITPPVTSYLYASIGSASFRGIGSQNTRKAGRGI